MRYLILSDIHGNWEALQAVMREADADRFDAVLCLGDVVGYGADPNRVADWVRTHAKAVVRGNHDRACVGLENLEWFNPAARASALWTQSTLSEENREWLRGLPKGPVQVADFQILHGSPLDEDEYLLHAKEAGNLMGYLETKVSFFGHTHVQGGFELLRGGVRNIRPFGYGGDREELQVDLDSYYLINPGSVGQPRDRDPRAAWVVYEPKERLLIFRRVSYEIQETQRKIVDAGLPDILARRLRTGQ